MDAARRAGEKAQIERLHFAIADLAYAAQAARFLAASHWRTVGIEKQFDPMVAAVLESGIFVTYARAFVEADGLPEARVRGLLSTRQRETHDWVIEQRHQVAAHVDRSNEARALVLDVTVTAHTEAGEVTIDGPFDRRSPSTPDQLLAIAGLAEHLAAKYREQVMAAQADAGG